VCRSAHLHVFPVLIVVLGPGIQKMIVKAAKAELKTGRYSFETDTQFID
jgi:hypothetical protein